MWCEMRNENGKTVHAIMYDDGTEETYKLKEISDEEFQHILSEHKRWVESEGEEGNIADFSKRDLSRTDLSKTCLRGVNFSYAHLLEANLSRTDLTKANLSKAYLMGADLSQAILNSADLSRAYLWYSNLSNAKLSHANLVKADLNSANLSKADLTKANLSKAGLSMVDLNNAHLWDTNLRHANLSDANLSYAHLKGNNICRAQLWGADLSKARLWSVNLSNAHLRGSNLSEASLKGSKFNGTDLREANLEEANVTGIQYDRKTLCKGIRVATCYGNALFKRFAEDQDFLEELREQRWSGRRLKGSFSKIEYDFGNWGEAVYQIWRLFADCGRSFSRWGIWCLFFIALFAALYTPTPDCLKPFMPGFMLDTIHDFGASFQQTADAYGDQPMTFWSALYFSIVTFTTLGFGDVVAANGPARFWVTVEVIIGYIMLGGLISILANKLARRS